MNVLGGIAAAAAAVAAQNSASVQPGAAQPQPAPPARADQGRPPSGETITVTGRRNEIQTSTDRVSYPIANDIQGTTGSMADVLRNIPSLEVDPEGNLSVRGDPNVVILIDGQPSATLRGPNRGAGLQQLPASQYERVEVITNPSAAFGPEGSGGVINLIPKRVRRAGLSGSVRANAGARGRANGGLSLAYSSGGTTLSEDLGFRRDDVSSSSDRVRERLDRASGRFLTARQESRSVTETLSGTLKTRVEHSLDKATRLSLEASGSSLRSDAEVEETYVAEPSSAGDITDYLRSIAIDARIKSGELRGRASRSFGSNEHRLSVDGSYQNSSSNRRLSSITDIAAPAPGEINEAFRFGIDQDLFQLKADYSRPLPDEAKLQLGYELEQQSNRYDNFGARSAAGEALVPLPSFTNRFRHEQTVMGLYGTVEARLGKLTALAGLRLEQAALDLAQVTTGERTVYDYFRVYPTLHLSYALSEREQLRASYSRRIQRPQGQDLNPFREYRDPFNVRAGNPLLSPQVTDSLEAGWQRREGTTFYQGTLYYRHTNDAFTDIIQELGGGVLLTSRANLGSSRNVGAELIANRRLGSKLTLNASVNGAWNEIDAGNLGFFRRRSAAQFSGRGSLNWRPTAKDQVQLSGFLSGRTLRPQGYRGASGMISLGYRHQFTDALSFVATARDLLDNFGETIVYDTPEFRDRAERKFGGRIIFVGFSYTFGGNKGSRRDPSFDFEGGRTE